MFALYSPLAALPSYLPTLGRLDRRQHTRLSVALFINVAVISLVSLWGGEYILVLLGVSTAALSATGGIALIYEAVILMLGLHHAPETVPAADNAAEGGSAASWRTVAFLPVTFPLTIGGATVGLLIAFSANANNVTGRLILSLAALGYAAVTGITIFHSRFPAVRPVPEVQGHRLDRGPAVAARRRNAPRVRASWRIGRYRGCRRWRPGRLGSARGG